MKLDILMIIKTSDLKYDDRLKKEIDSLRRLKKTVVIRGVIQNNLKTKGVIYENVNFKTFKILSRNVLPHKKFLIIKVTEMYICFLISIIRIRPKVVWIHNMEMIGMIPILNILKKANFINRIIWDQHELPPEKYFIKQGLIKRLQKAYNKCDYVIAANEPRLNQIKQNFKLVKSRIILNYPDANFAKQKSTPLNKIYNDFLNGRNYFITIGTLNENKRYISIICEAILQSSDYCLIVMGPYNSDTTFDLEKKYGYRFKTNIYFTGMVSHDEILSITDHAFASIVFYNDNALNSKYCAPNRLYQAILRGVPVISGNNPTMLEVINKFKIGYAIESDGKDVYHIIDGINNLNRNREIYIKNINEVKQLFNWEINDNIIEGLLNDL